MHGYGVDNGWWDKVASDPGYQEIWGRIADRAGTGNRFTILNAAFAYTLSKQDKFGDLCKRVVTGLKVPRGKENSYKRCIGPAAYAAAFDAVADGKFVSLMGIEGGHIIEESLPALRNFYRLGVRYMTRTPS
ncbi:MAG: membrane dipeptidase, partial [Planctomycetes bacterium]|nr:membrane dipeptidase [Planctomycetota bacterium]